MVNKNYSFLKIFEVELDDLREQFLLKSEKIDNQHKNNEISDYVYKHNSSLIRHKLLNLNNIVNAVLLFKPEEYSNLKHLLKALDAKLVEVADKYRIANTLRIKVLKKIEKVETYVNIDH